jgi:hypothetical protein
VYLYLSFWTSFGRLWAHNQEKQLCLCDTCYLLFCVKECLVCRVDSTLHTRQSWTHSRPKHVETDKYKYTKIHCAPVCFYLQGYTKMHGQQNIKFADMYVLLQMACCACYLQTSEIQIHGRCNITRCMRSGLLLNNTKYFKRVKFMLCVTDGFNSWKLT